MKQQTEIKQDTGTSGTENTTSNETQLWFDF